MKIRFVHHAAAAVACVGLLVPQSAFSAPAVAAKSAMQGDIELRDGGLFVGQVVDAQGAPLAETEVSIRQAKDEIVRTVTDKNGVFAAKGLRGGEYQVITAGGQVSYRLWAAGTAPPSASRGALIVTGDEVLNGQCSTCGPAGCPPGGCPSGGPIGGGGGGVVGWVKNHPMLVAAGIAAAIAIPVALADDDDPTS